MWQVTKKLQVKFSNFLRPELLLLGCHFLAMRGLLFVPVVSCCESCKFFASPWEVAMMKHHEIIMP
ncbi:uncharacterized protein J3R85_002071 [Psidium guajava]|nr:uncharacterized protein J3R85_002071 [Psidium guajava]